MNVLGNCQNCGEMKPCACSEKKASPLWSILSVFEQITPPPPPYRRFRVLETYMSCDGPRTRVSEKGFATLEEANWSIGEGREQVFQSNEGTPFRQVDPAEADAAADLARTRTDP